MELGWAEQRYLEWLATLAEARQRRAQIVVRVAELDVLTALLKYRATIRRRRVN